MANPRDGGVVHPSLLHVISTLENTMATLPLGTTRVVRPQQSFDSNNGRDAGLKNNTTTVQSVEPPEDQASHLFTRERRNSTGSTCSESTAVREEVEADHNLTTNTMAEEKCTNANFESTTPELGVTTATTTYSPMSRQKKQRVNPHISPPPPPIVPLEMDKRDALSSVDVESLKRHLAPVRRALEQIDGEGMLGLRRTQGGACLGNGASVEPIHNLIKPPRSMTGGGSCVRYLHVSEEENQYSIGIFVFPPHSSIPLHDHPGMCVLSRVLYGDLTVKSFDLTHEGDVKSDGSKSGAQFLESIPNLDLEDLNARQSFSSVFSWGNSGATPTEIAEDGVARGGASRGGTSSWFSSLLLPLRRDSTATSSRSSVLRRKMIPEGSKHALRNRTKRICAPDVTVLYPYEGNAHEFTSGPNGAAVLDVLLPPYDFDHDRDCTFYRVEVDTETILEDDRMDTNDKELCWLVPTPQPENFLCISGVFGELGCVEDDEDDVMDGAT